MLYSYLLELDEDWYHSDDPINAGVTFFVKVHNSMMVLHNVTSSTQFFSCCI